MLEKCLKFVYGNIGQCELVVMYPVVWEPSEHSPIIVLLPGHGQHGPETGNSFNLFQHSINWTLGMGQYCSRFEAIYDQ